VLLARTFGDAMACVVRETGGVAGAGTGADPSAVPAQVADLAARFCELCRCAPFTPLTLNPRLSALNPQPSTLDAQPSTLNPKPSTLNPQHSTHNTQPSTLNPQSSTFNP